MALRFVSLTSEVKKVMQHEEYKYAKFTSFYLNFIQKSFISFFQQDPVVFKL